MCSLFNVVISGSATSQVPILQWLSALGPTIIGLFVALIAWRQWVTARNKLKLDMFERRVKIFDGLEQLRRVALDAHYDPETYVVDRQATISVFDSFTSAQWLFSDAVHEQLTRDLQHAWFKFVGAYVRIRAVRSGASVDNPMSVREEDEQFEAAFASIYDAVLKCQRAIAPALRLQH